MDDGSENSENGARFGSGSDNDNDTGGDGDGDGDVDENWSVVKRNKKKLSLNFFKIKCKELFSS